MTSKGEWKGSLVSLGLAARRGGIHTAMRGIAQVSHG